MKNAAHHRIHPLPTLVGLSVLVFTASTVSAGVNVWTTNWPEGGNILALAIDPANPATLYAGAAGGSVFKTTNGGESWAGINNGRNSAYINALAIDPSDSATLYAAGSNDGGVFKSINAGESWTAINDGLTNLSVVDLAIDPSAPSTLYAGTEAVVSSRAPTAGRAGQR